MYELDSNGDHVVLGRGSFGAVYFAIDLVIMKKMLSRNLTMPGKQVYVVCVCQ